MDRSDSHLLLNTIRGEQTDRFPVWVMRQAGRIFPEYRAVRSRLSGFKELVETAERAAEVTVQPVDLLGVDAAIIFSDILVVPEAMGLPYQMVEKKGPWFEKTIQSVEDLSSIDDKIDVADRLAYVAAAIRIAKKEIGNRVPLIGFCGAPWTVFCYMTEGEGSKTFSKSRRLLYRQAEMAHQLLEKITQVSIAYLKLQIAAGADAVQLFDSWAGILGPTTYATFGIAYIKRICDAITTVPVTVFAKGAHHAMGALGRLNCEVVGMDWCVDIAESRQSVGRDKTLQGNLDPCVLYGDFDTIKRNTREMLLSFGGQRHIANLGHGVYPDTDPEKVKCFIDTVKEFARPKS